MVMPTHIIAVGGIVEDGQVEVGENLLEALAREVNEESGADKHILNLIGVYSNTGTYKWYDGVTDVPTKLMLDYVCEYVGGELTASAETSDVQWVEKENVLDFISAPPIRTRYEAFLEFEGNVTYMSYVSNPAFVLNENRMI